MLITADFSIIPSAYAKDAPEDARVDSVPCVSFPFYIDQLNPRAKYLHWEFSDPDSIPVCGFEWIHWTVANLPVDAIMFDPSDAHALSIPADFSRSLPSMVPEALQGRNSSASPFWAAAPTRRSSNATTGLSRRTRTISTRCRCGARASRLKDSNRASGSTSCSTGSNAASPCAMPAA